MNTYPVSNGLRENGARFASAGSGEHRRGGGHIPLAGKVSIAVLLIAATGLCIVVPQVPLFFFACIVAGVLLRSAGVAVSRRIPVSPSTGIAITLLVFATVASLAIWAAAPQIAQQSSELAGQLSQLDNRWDALTRESAAARWVEQHLPSFEALSSSGGAVLSRLGGFFSSFFGLFVNAFLIAVVGLYLATGAEQYLHGLLRLFPAYQRTEAEHVLRRTGNTIRGWLMGQLFSMSFIGVCVFAGLTVLGVPMALLFALIAALLAFIPNLGPVLSVVPPTLIALTKDPWLALWVLLLYVTIQMIEGNLLTPMVMREVIDLPPALLIVSQVLLAALFGFWGLLLAAPLSAVGMVLVEELHVKPMDHATASRDAGTESPATS